MPSAAFDFPPSSQLVDGLTGIVNFVTTVESKRSDPDIFGTAVQTGDMGGFGFPGGNHRVLGCGAGLTYDDALWAAVGEAVERYCVEIVPEEDLVVASYQQLRERGEEAVAPHQWALFAPHQHEGGKLPFAPFKEETPLAWVKMDHLTRRCECYVPACLAFFLRQSMAGAEVVAPGHSTGAACAQTVGEGIFKGICEIVERDAFMITWRNRLPCPRVEIDPQSAIYELVQEKFMRPGLDFTVVQTTLDLPIPSFFGMVRICRRDPPMILCGGACHPDPNKAVLKTLLELTQGVQWANHVGDKKTFVVEEGYANVRSFDDRMELYAFTDQREAFRFLFDHPQVVKLSSIPSVDQGNDRANTRWCSEQLARRNVDMLAADITSADVAEAGLSVIRVLSPQCEAIEGDHRAPFLGGKRWREVPVQLGLRSQPLSLENINPFPHPYP